ncbi:MULTISPECIES: hypothetical protein [Lactobacillaceae]|uniref:hypothetical protein n=1 Tax=Lactobacillaceae TaxID=33958 RepID=UPI00242D2B60|nr:hypothetical protein [Lactobacillus intestinalis]
MASRNRYSGNKFSLRAKPTDMLRRWDFVSNRLNVLGDILISTWGSTIVTLVVLIIGFFFIFRLFVKYNAIILQNIPVIILITIGTLCIALQTLFINPSEGSQFKVSIRFLRRKFYQLSKNKTYVKLRPYRFARNTDERDVLVDNSNGNFIAGYLVTGVVSPTSFDADLAFYTELNKTVLTNLEKDTTLVTDVAINKVIAQKLALPDNATQEMIIERNRRYNRSVQNRENKNIEIRMFLVSPTIEILQKRRSNFEVQLSNGLVVGYYPLSGSGLKKSIRKIYS